MSTEPDGHLTDAELAEIEAEANTQVDFYRDLLADTREALPDGWKDAAGDLLACGGVDAKPYATILRLAAEVRRLKKQRDRLVEVLDGVTWRGHGNPDRLKCAACGMRQMQGHAPDCPVAGIMVGIIDSDAGEPTLGWTPEEGRHDE